MSLSELLDNKEHVWANLRVNNLTIDEELIAPGGDPGESFIMPVIYGGTLWPGTQNKNILFTKKSNRVTMHLEAAKASSVGGTGREIIITETIPLRFRPISMSGSDLFVMPISGWESGDYVAANLIINLSGQIIIQFKTTPVGVTCGIDNCSFTWLTELL